VSSYDGVLLRSVVVARHATVREAMKQIAPGEPIFRLNTLSDLVEYWLSPQKFNSLLLAIFAGLALVLAAIGIYGVIAYSVVQRTREIGIRMALGADRANVLRLILRQGARIGMLGLIIGTAAAYLSTRALFWHALWSRSTRSIDLCRNSRISVRRSLAGLLYSCASRHTRRSADSAAV
jgi:ABC-type lipoprotein release transport system permease subunit